MMWLAYLYRDGQKAKTELFTASSEMEAIKIIESRRGCLDYKIIKSFASFTDALHWIKEGENHEA